MRICIDARNIRESPSGLCRYAMHIVCGMAAIDHENEYFILRDKRFQKRIVDNKNFHDIYDPLKDTGSAQNALFGSFVVNPLKVDVFHTLNQVVPFGLKAKKIISTVHDLMWFDAPELSFDNKWIAKGANILARTSFAYSYRRCTHVVCISKATETIFKNHFPELGHKTKVVSHHDVFFMNPDTKTKFELEDLNQDLSTDYILSLGNTKPYKNVDGVLHAFSKIAKQYPQLKVVVAGRLDRRQPLTELANTLNISDQVYFLKQQISEHDLKLLIKNAKFMAFPSFYEGYGIPILEAISLGCPVMGSTIDVVKETSGGTAAYVNPNDFNEMARMMEKILLENDFRNQLIKNGYEYMDRLKDYDSVKMTHDLYLD